MTDRDSAILAKRIEFAGASLHQRPYAMGAAGQTGWKLYPYLRTTATPFNKSPFSAVSIRFLLRWSVPKGYPVLDERVASQNNIEQTAQNA